MAGKVKTLADTSEYSQSLIEQQILEECELHGWATAVSVANPVEILIMFEDEDEDYNLKSEY